MSDDRVRELYAALSATSRHGFDRSAATKFLHKQERQLPAPPRLRKQWLIAHAGDWLQNRSSPSCLRNDVHFIMVGGGTELAALRELARRMSLDDRVEFTGRIPDAALWQIMSTADVCVNPVRANAMNDKSTMNKILEYIALAKPVVQFDLTEGRFSAGEASDYARPNDTEDFASKLCELLDDPERQAHMGAIGRSRIEAGLAWHHRIPPILKAYQTSMKSDAARTKSLDTRSG